MWSDEVQRRHGRRNYLALVGDGSWYAAGTALVAAESVLPSVLQELGAPTWLIGFAPNLGVIGYFAVPVFTAHVIERLSRFLPFVAWISLSQRLPSLVIGLTLLLLWGPHPELSLWIVTLAVMTVGFGGGAAVTAFYELVAKVVPASRRSSNIATRSLIGTILGFAAGGVIAAVLARWRGPAGYGVLYLGNFVCFTFSLIALCCVRELPHVPARRGGSPGWRTTLRLLPHWWREDPLVRRYALARFFGFGIGVLTPFLAIHARATLGAPDSFLGRLVSAQMAGAIAGNLLAGWLGDRRGARIVAQMGAVVGIALCAATLVNQAEAGFLAMFFALGMTTFLTNIGAVVLMIELFPAERRPTCVSLVSLLALPGMLLSGWLAGMLHTASGAITPAALVALVLVAVSFWNYSLLPEPRIRSRGA